MLHRYRSAMVRPGRELLAGQVEVDEAYVGGVEERVHGRETETKAIVAIAVEISNPKGFRADQAGSHPGRVQGEPPAVHRRDDRTGRNGSHRRMAGVSDLGR